MQQPSLLAPVPENTHNPSAPQNMELVTIIKLAWAAHFGVGIASPGCSCLSRKMGKDR